jgi:hypothetical protein
LEGLLVMNLPDICSRGGQTTTRCGYGVRGKIATINWEELITSP